MSIPESPNYFVWGSIQIITIIIITLIITLITCILKLKPILKDDIEKYRCKYYLIPFISLIDNTKTTSSNFDYCVRKATRPLFKKRAENNLRPGLNDSVKKTEEAAQKTKQVAVLADKIKEKYDKKMNSISGVYERIRELMTYISIKMHHIFQKIGSTLIVLYFFMITLMNSSLISIGLLYKVINLLAYQTTQFLTIALYYFSVAATPGNMWAYFPATVNLGISTSHLTPKVVMEAAELTAKKNSYGYKHRKGGK